MQLKSLKRSWAAAFAIVASTPVAAEVCDKVRPAWNPADGSVSQLDDLVLFLVEPLGLIVLVLTLAGVLLRKIWFTAIVVTLLIAIIALDISTWVAADDITNLALVEGCIAAPVLTTITLTAMGTIVFVTTGFSSRSRKSAI